MADLTPVPASGSLNEQRDHVLDTLHGAASLDQEPPDDVTGQRSGLGQPSNDAAVVIEQAKGALMLHYGIAADTALDVLGGWARAGDVDTVTIAETVMGVISQRGQESAADARPALVRWVRAQLRHSNGPPLATQDMSGSSGIGRGDADEGDS